MISRDGCVMHLSLFFVRSCQSQSEAPIGRVFKIVSKKDS